MRSSWATRLSAATLAFLLLRLPLAAQTRSESTIHGLFGRQCLKWGAGPPVRVLPYCQRETLAIRLNNEFHACRKDQGAESKKIQECLIAERGWTRDTAELLLATYRAEMRRDSASGNAEQQYRACDVGAYAARIRDCLVAEFGLTSDSAERVLDPHREGLSRDSAEIAFLATVPPGMMPCVASEKSTILVYDASSADSGAQPRSTLGGRRTCIGQPIDMASNGRGDLYVLSQGPMIENQLWTNAVTVFASGDSGDAPPRRRILVPPVWNSLAPGMGLDREGNIYVTTGDYPPLLDDQSASDTVHGAVQVYPPDADSMARPIRILAGDSTCLERPTSIGFDSRGLMYVVNQGRITVYDGDAGGNTPPIRIIEGPRTGLAHPLKLAVGPGDTLFVLNGARWHPKRYFDPTVTVTVYAPDAMGDEVPVRTLIVRHGRDSEGGRHGLFSAEDLAVDSRGVLYVATYGSVAVYPIGAEGDVAPTRIVREPNRDRAWGRSVMLDGSGRLYVAKEPTITGF